MPSSTTRHEWWKLRSMSMPRKIMLFVTLWAFALQASAGVVGTACVHNGNQNATAVLSPMAGTAVRNAPDAVQHNHHAAHLAMAGNANADGDNIHANHQSTDASSTTTTSATSCCDCDCRCDSDVCSSPVAGLVLARDMLTVAFSRDALLVRAVTADLLQAHRFALIRPPGIS